MSVKTLIPVLLFCLQVFISKGQLPSWQWVKTAAGSDYDIAVKSCTDPFGNFYVAGNYKSTSLVFETDTLHTAGGYDIFIVKYDSSGNELWVRSFGEQTEENFYDITSDSNGNIYLTGSYNDTLSFAGDTLYSTYYHYSMFIIKYDASGNEIWGNGVTGTGLTFYVVGASIVCDNNDDIIVTGRFKSPTITFDTLVVNDVYNTDIFIAKYNVDGDVLWAQSAGGFMDDWGLGVDCDSANNIYVTGMFGYPGMTIGAISLQNEGSTDAFLLKLNPSGTLIWARSVGDSLFEVGASVEVDNNGNPIITGNFESPSISIGTTTLYNNGISNMFIAKYGGVGNLQWAHGSESPGRTNGYDLGCDGAGNIFLAGWFDSTFAAFGSDTVFSLGGEEVYVIKYDNNGVEQWILSPSGSMDERCFGIDVSPSGDVTLSGTFESSPLNFGPIVLNNTTSAFQDLFIARLGISTFLPELPEQQKMVVWPNPGNETFRIRLPEGVQKIFISDLPGRVISTVEGTGILTFQLENPGLYFVRTENLSIPASKLLVVKEK